MMALEKYSLISDLGRRSDKSKRTEINGSRCKKEFQGPGGRGNLAIKTLSQDECEPVTPGRVLWGQAGMASERIACQREPDMAKEATEVQHIIAPARSSHSGRSPGYRWKGTLPTSTFKTNSA